MRQLLLAVHLRRWRKCSVRTHTADSAHSCAGTWHLCASTAATVCDGSSIISKSYQSHYGSMHIFCRSNAHLSVKCSILLKIVAKHLVLQDPGPSPVEQLHHCIVGREREQRRLPCRMQALQPSVLMHAHNILTLGSLGPRLPRDMLIAMLCGLMAKGRWQHECRCYCRKHASSLFRHSWSGVKNKIISGCQVFPSIMQYNTPRFAQLAWRQ